LYHVSASNAGVTPAAALLDGLRRLELEFLPYVPCSTAAPVLAEIGRWPGTRTLPVTREEEGVGVVCGHVLAGRRAALMMQDTGFGNALTALLTFAVPYHVPAFIVATRTGGAGEINSAVPEYSERLPDVLNGAGLFHALLDARLPLEQWPAEIVALNRYARTAHRPVIVLADLQRRP
jgi:sulfopyruvate decarboxylase TPP-binding subunit